ncbi:hypothetical protein MKW98_012128 [Papaver atlanticum]|uniref:Uncharacterized protein n=1 Tax=Papaver atlanticum TaxID=357466 RepID=A0AAD4TDZ0_9MAGN|nr:hypothetical protein MKW98_012128 [Papaver atlanticum]
MLQDGSIFAQSPSFNSYSSDNFAQIAAKVCEEFVDDRVQLGLEPLQNEGENHDDDEIVQVQEEEKEDDLLEEHKEEEKANEEEEEEEDESEFEFSFLSGDGIAISADEIFANGQIRPVYPIFNRDLLFAGGKDYDEDDDHTDSKQPKKNSSLRKLFIGEREEDDGHSCSSSEADELDNLPAGTYCVWKPKQQSSTTSSPDTCKKSKSTGSSSSSSSRSATTAASVSKRWRFRDFLFRSNSDGKDTFVFLTPSSGTSTNKMMMKNRKEEKLVIEEKLEKVVVSGNKAAAGKGKLKSGAAAKAVTEVSAHEIHYVRNRALKENDRKKSYLPYRQDLVGFFANVNGLNRNLHPF